MAVIPRTGSLPSTSLSPGKVIVDQNDVVDQAAFIKNSLIHKTATNPESYPEKYGAINGYLEGSRVNVTFFKRVLPTDRKTDAIDVSSTRHIIHTNYTRIKNLEITLTDGIFPNQNPEKGEVTITGDAVFYGFTDPSLGDLFVMPTFDGQSGLWRITTVEPMSVYTSTNWKVTYCLHEIASLEIIQKLVDQSVKTQTFVKDLFLKNMQCLLEEDSYQQLISLQKLRKLMITHYYSEYFDSSSGTIFHPDGSYDPYLVYYLNEVVSLEDGGYRRLSQLFSSYEHADMGLKQSLWYRLLDTENLSIKHLQGTYSHIRTRYTRYDANITRLALRQMIFLRKDRFDFEAQNFSFLDDHVGYVLSAEFYAGNYPQMTDFERVVFLAIIQRQVGDIDSFINVYLANFRDVPYEEAYYTLPLYLYLTDLCLSQLSP